MSAHHPTPTGATRSTRSAHDADRAVALHVGLSASSGDHVDAHIPATGELLHRLPLSSPADVVDAVGRARVAQRSWALAGFTHRRRVLLRAHDAILDRRDELVELVRTETGKTRGQAFEEVFEAAMVTRYYALSAQRMLRSERRRAGIPLVVRTRVAYRPVGVVGVITPWNYPLALASMDVVPALAAGCGVVEKADVQAALSVLALREIFVEAGVPAALWSVTAGDGAVIGGAITDHVDHVCFTGSTATGRTVAAQAADRLIGASLELGGKNPLVVLDDADPERAAADAAYGCFSAMGQLCVSAERILVQRGVADAFRAALVRRLCGLRIGADDDADVGTLLGPSQLNRVRRHLDDALARGATVLTGGRHRDDIGPYFFEPTVLENVTPEMDCFAEETFGAVVALSVFDSDDDAIDRANEGDYGLNASVLGSSRARMTRIAARLDAGSVNINEGYRATFASTDAPMGGMKQSGVGRRNGREGLRRFVEPVTVSVATGLLTLPRTASEFAAMTPPMVLLARALRAMRRR